MSVCECELGADADGVGKLEQHYYSPCVNFPGRADEPALQARMEGEGNSGREGSLHTHGCVDLTAT